MECDCETALKLSFLLVFVFVFFFNSCPNLPDEVEMSFTECNLVGEGSHLGIGPVGWIFAHLPPIHVRQVVLSLSAPKAIETAVRLGCRGGC